MRTVINALKLAAFNARHVRPAAAAASLFAQRAFSKLGREDALGVRQFRFVWDGREFHIRIPEPVCFDVLRELFYGRLYDLEGPLRDGAVVLDVGANVGFATLYFALVHPGCRIHAFEPVPSNFECLKHNTRPLGKRVTCVNAAVWNSSGKVRIQYESSIGSHVTGKKEGIETPCVRLDEYLRKRGIGKVDVLKLDAEGAEMQVLEGLGKRIADVDRIIGEAHLWAVSEKKLRGFLKKNGFETRRWDVDGEFVTFDASRTAG